MIDRDLLFFCNYLLFTTLWYPALASHDVDLVFLDFFNLLKPCTIFMQFSFGCDCLTPSYIVMSLTVGSTSSNCSSFPAFRRTSQQALLQLWYVAQQALLQPRRTSLLKYFLYLHQWVSILADHRRFDDAGDGQYLHFCDYFRIFSMHVVWLPSSFLCVYSKHFVICHYCFYTLLGHILYIIGWVRLAGWRNRWIFLWTWIMLFVA
jgi:hypothetical protein